MVKITVFVSDKFLVESLKSAIEKDKNYCVTVYNEHACNLLNVCLQDIPDIIILDFEKMQFDSIDTLELIKSRLNSVKILVLTSFAEEDYIRKSIDIGIDGYILNSDIDTDTIVNVIECVRKGIKVFGETVLERVWDEFACTTVKPSIDIRLTSKEIRILKLNAQGKTNKEIAELAHLSKGRIANIFTEMLARLNLRNRTELAAFAVRNKLIE